MKQVNFEQAGELNIKKELEQYLEAYRKPNLSEVEKDRIRCSVKNIRVYVLNRFEIMHGYSLEYSFEQLLECACCATPKEMFLDAVSDLLEISETYRIMREWDCIEGF